MGHNPGQADLDNDFEGDRCDTDDGLIYLFFESPENPEWQAEQGFDSWNLYRGDLAVLRNSCAAASCLYTQAPGSNPIANMECGLNKTWMEDAEVQMAGTTAYYLTTGVSGGIESGLGQDSVGTNRPNDNPCP